jgi:[ribosomal protein S5]-alanine N-acetyltransferase
MARMIIYEGEVSQSSNAEVSNAVIVGRIGFHGHPDERGMVEVGYEIDEAHRKRGHARTALRIMVDIARAIDDVKVLRASVYEENWISRRVVEGEGLRYVGKEIHPRKGLQNVFEMDVSTGTV